MNMQIYIAPLRWGPQGRWNVAFSKVTIYILLTEATGTRFVFVNCATVWNPYYAKDKLLLDRVQHHFMRLFKKW